MWTVWDQKQNWLGLNALKIDVLDGAVSRCKVTEFVEISGDLNMQWALFAVGSYKKQELVTKLEFQNSFYCSIKQCDNNLEKLTHSKLLAQI